MEYKSFYPIGYILNWTLTPSQAAMAEEAMRYYTNTLAGDISFEYLPRVLQRHAEQTEKLKQGLLEMKALLFPKLPFVRTSPDFQIEIGTANLLTGRLVSLILEADVFTPTLTIALTEKEMRTMADGIEYYSRVLGSFRVLDLPAHLRLQVLEVDDKLGPLFQRLNLYLHPDLSPGYNRGVGWSENPLQQALQRSYELYKTLLKFDMNQRSVSNVHSGPILHYSDWPLAQVTPYQA